MNAALSQTDAAAHALSARRKQALFFLKFGIPTPENAIGGVAKIVPIYELEARPARVQPRTASPQPRVPTGILFDIREEHWRITS